MTTYLDPPKVENNLNKTEPMPNRYVYQIVSTKRV